MNSVTIKLPIIGEVTPEHIAAGRNAAGADNTSFVMGLRAWLSAELPYYDGLLRTLYAERFRKRGETYAGAAQAGEYLAVHIMHNLVEEGDIAAEDIRMNHNANLIGKKVVVARRNPNDAPEVSALAGVFSEPTLQALTDMPNSIASWTCGIGLIVGLTTDPVALQHVHVSPIRPR